MQRPKPESYPKVRQTIGDHIRAWRMDNHLLQADVARILSVCEDSVVGWETQRVIPTVRQMPGIIAMIGYIPVEIDTSTLGGRITQYRYMRGMTLKHFGEMIPAEASSVQDWEKNIYFPSKRKREKIESIINGEYHEK